MRTIAFILFSLFISNAAFSQSLAEKEKTKIWQNFRESYPNPYQTIGFAQFNDNSQLYLVSEPPSYVKLSDITGLFEGFDYSVEVKTWKIGYDGWVKDVLIYVNYIPPVYKLLLVKQLNELLYANSYKPICKELPVVQPRRLFIINNNIDYRISAMELDKWFVEDNMQFAEVEDTTNQSSFNELLNTPKAGVYISKDYAFVVWSIPYNNHTGFSRENIGKFVIESDIILGAISNSKTVFVIGRARQCSYAELPPLRIETIEMLAGTKNENLSQSLNIAELITGKMDNGADWCPAFLSDELENDEFGHLLTMTDIFLKDWLTSGILSYPEYKYPKPNRYYEMINSNNIRRIRYNWNTENYIYSTDFYDRNVIAFRNTACLNASLFDASEAEEKDMSNTVNSEANKYLASLNNADLARVVQYTALYQIFKANNMQYNTYYKPHTIDKTTLLLKDTREILTKLRSLSNDEIRTISRRIEEDYFKLYLYQNLQMLADTKREEWKKEFEKAVEKAAKENSMTSIEFMATEKYKNGREKSLQEFNRKINIWIEESKEKTISERAIEQYTNIEALRNKLYNLSYSDFSKLCNYVSYPNGEYSSDYSSIRYLSGEITKLYWPIWLNAKYFGINIEKVKDDYVTALITDNENWIKTPKVVVTNNSFGRTQVGDNTYINVSGMIGGHSLSSSVKKTQADRTEKVRTVIAVLRTTPDEYNYARGTGNTSSSNIVHNFPYGNNNDNEEKENARIHYETYNNNAKATSQHDDANNQNNEEIERYVAYYDDILKPQTFRNNTDNKNTPSQNITKKVNNVSDPSWTRQIPQEHKQKEDKKKYEPFEWTQKEYKQANVIDVKTGDALVDATFYSSMATAEKKDADKAAYYAKEAAIALSGNSGEIAVDPVFADRLTRITNEKLLIQQRISSAKKDFSQKAKSARNILALLGDNISENTRQTLERYADRADKFFAETNNVIGAKDETEKIRQLEERSNRMGLHAFEIKEQAIKDINGCESCPTEKKEELTRMVVIY